MKTRIAIFVLIAAAAVAIAGCTGTPVSVDPRGNLQPYVQVYQSPVHNNTGPWFEPRLFTMPNFPDYSLTLFSFTGFRVTFLPKVGLW